MVNFLLKGILIGILFGLRAGAVGAMTVQRTFHYGIYAGLLTGLGSSVADTFYAVVGAFGFTVISDFLLNRQNEIRFIGGCLILAMGVSLLLKKEKELSQEKNITNISTMVFSSFAVGITNPATILTFLFAFSWFKIEGRTSLSEGSFLVAGVFIGTFIWWIILASQTQRLKKRAKHIDLKKINQIFGIALILLGMIVFLTLIFSID